MAVATTVISEKDRFRILLSTFVLRGITVFRIFNGSIR
jgi:hypothetical protein